MSRTIDADALIEILTTAIRNMKGMAKSIGAEDDSEIQMEIKAYTDIANGVRGMPTIESERKKGKWIPVTQIYRVTEGHFPKTHIEWVDATEPDNIDGVRCSECGTVYDFTEARNWCSECGADMRGEQE